MGQAAEEMREKLERLYRNRSHRKSPGAGKVEAAGIEPARGSLRNSRLSGYFSAEVYLGDVSLEVHGSRLWVTQGCNLLSEERLEEAIPKLESLLRAAKLATRTQEV